MSLYTNPLVLQLRSAGRKLGLNRLFSPYKSDSNYEEQFHDILMSRVKQGMSVWDVGANIGYYTKLMSAAVATDGKVYAFEPAPKTIGMLEETIAGCTNVTIVPVALGSSIGEARFDGGADTIGGWGKVSIDQSNGSSTLSVQMATADSLVQNGTVSVPSVAKIDVEGFEHEVLKGMAATLRDRTLTCLCIEMHFAIMEERGMSGAPRGIETLLKEAGFALNWIGPSQLIAER